MIANVNEPLDVVVLKFGSSVLRSIADLDRVVGEIIRHVRDGRRVVAVVSAIGRSTDQLFDEARSVATEPDETATHLPLEARWRSFSNAGRPSLSGTGTARGP